MSSKFYLVVRKAETFFGGNLTQVVPGAESGCVASVEVPAEVRLWRGLPILSGKTARWFV
jgi:hypothetical protein